MQNDNVIHKEKYKGLTITLETDSEPESPRKWGSLGTMVCWHSRYNLGDEKPNGSLEEELYDMCELWGDDRTEANLERVLKEKFVILPLYLYDHSGITMSTGSFGCRWDSGKVGFIYCSLTKALKEFNVNSEDLGWEAFVKNSGGKTLRQQITDILEAEVKIYDCYLTGDVVEWVVTDENGEEVKSVEGFYPDMDVEYKDRWGATLQEARECVDDYVENFDYASL